MKATHCDPNRAVCVTFFMEQHIGHKTYYQNLRRFIDQPAIHCDKVTPHWVKITYEKPTGLMKYLPFLPGKLRDILIGREQVQQGLRAPYDLAFFNTQIPAALNLEILHRKPYFLSADNTPIQFDQMAAYYGRSSDPGGLLSAIKRRANRWLFQHAAGLFPWSHWVAGSLINDYGVSPERIHVIPPGVDIEWWRANSHKESHRAFLTESPQPCQILFVGGDLYRKGGRCLLEAFHKLPPGLAQLHLVTRTEIPPEENIFIYNDMQPNSAELLALYQLADVFVLPSKAEAFGIAAVEASAAELPVIASRIGGLSDIVIPGQTGFLIEPDDSNTLAAHLMTLCTSPQLRLQMGEAARLRAKTFFDARKNAEHVVSILLETSRQMGKK